MRIEIRVLAIVVSAAVSAPLSHATQEAPPPPSFRADVDLKLVRVGVFDDEGQPVTGLDVHGFAVREDRVPREIELVLTPEGSHLDLAFVVDLSASVERDFPRARRHAKGFLESLAPRDCVWLLPFNADVPEGTWVQAGSAGAREMLESFPSRAGTRLYDALTRAITRFAAVDSEEPRGACATGEPDGPRRRVIVLLTDGIDEGSTARYGDVLLAAVRSGVPIFSVAVGAAGVTRRQTRRRSSRSFLDETPAFRDFAPPAFQLEQIAHLQAELREIARVTGGQFIQQRDFERGVAELLAYLRGTYIIGYRQPEPPAVGWHDVEIETPGRRYRVLAQAGYYVLPEPPAAVVRGRQLYVAGCYEDALRQFDAAIAEAPDLGDSFFGRALAAQALGRFEVALESYQRALEQRPGMPPIHAKLAEVLLRLGDVDNAWRHAVRARRGGMASVPALDELKATTPEPPRLDRLRAGPVVHLASLAAASLVAQLDLQPLWRQVGDALLRADAFVLTAWPLPDAYTIDLQIDEYDAQRGATEGRLMLFTPDGKLLDAVGVRFSFRPSAAALPPTLAKAVSKIAERLAKSDLR